ncbi:MAG: pyruvate kinase, partial [Acidobacteriota bacterium]
MAHTKIVCTLGPASHSEDRILEMAEARMDVARLNFSHSTREDHAGRLRAVRSVSRRVGRPLAVLQDLQGPKIRLGEFYEHLPKDVKKGDRIFLTDGTIEVRVEKIAGDDVQTVVARGGVVRAHQGINLPGVALSAPALTKKDKSDLAFGLELGVDIVALSFVRKASDVKGLKRILAGAEKPPWIVAKIEKPEAMDNLEAILKEVHGVMVARGDLGVEIGPEHVPQAQKIIITEANRRGKFVITATQMLESMIDHPTPTRAEVSDVANAIYDGSDAVMLSAESAVGNYPVEAVSVLHRIARETESSRFYHPEQQPFTGVTDFHHAASHAAASAAEDLKVAAVISITPTGRMPRL